MPTKKKEDLLGRSRALIAGKKITSLSDFQETPTEDAAAEKADAPDVAGAPASEQPAVSMDIDEKPTTENVRTTTYHSVHRRTRVAAKVVRENFRFTEELSAALERYVAERRLKKNTVVEIALEQHLKQEGFL
jgi:hypothetical protein